jgi:undecaprenyl diphosphate synthase
MSNNGRLDIETREQELLESLVSSALPHHVAIVMDGNGRWGQERGMTRAYGHRESVDSVRQAVTLADDLKIPYLSLFCFSTENTQRPEDEVESLFRLFHDTLDAEVDKLHKKNVRIETTGLVDMLPTELASKFHRAVSVTENNTGLTLNLCVMYSGRCEIIEAVKKAAAAINAGELDPDLLTERRFRQFLFKPEIPDPDLVIRTSGEMRISNFLLWQMAYSELVFTDVLWPDFGRLNFLECLSEYQQRSRRFGRVT